jgi:hypothetical protein
VDLGSFPELALLWLVVRHFDVERTKRLLRISTVEAVKEVSGARISTAVVEKLTKCVNLLKM